MSQPRPASAGKRGKLDVGSAPEFIRLHLEKAVWIGQKASYGSWLNRVERNAGTLQQFITISSQ
jgi:hypothetical protein